MTILDMLRAIAGPLVVIAVALGWWLHPGFLLLAAFAGRSLLHSAITARCPMISLPRGAGLSA